MTAIGSQKCWLLLPVGKARNVRTAVPLKSRKNCPCLPLTVETEVRPTSKCLPVPVSLEVADGVPSIERPTGL